MIRSFEYLECQVTALGSQWDYNRLAYLESWSLQESTVIPLGELRSLDK